MTKSNHPHANEVEVTFASLGLCEPLELALSEKEYVHPSPIQAQTIPILLAGRDLIGIAQTGTGKTAAFALPILHRLHLAPKPRAPRRPRVLILTPTRELAAQIGDSFQAYGRHLRLAHSVVFGGVGQRPQVRRLEQGVDILIATPGRLLDLEQQGHVKFDQVEVFVLDEADRMLDMGFIHDVKKTLAKLPAQRQSLLFSATMPTAIQELADRLLRSPQRVEVAPVSSTAERVEQHLCFVGRGEKHKLLVHTLTQHAEGLVLVFVRMKHGANRLVDALARDGITADAIHGNKSQAARQRALENFKSGKTRVLVATDIAARGIDVKGVALVINFDLPEEPESYVHRIGRTARAGAEGLAIAFCDPSERHLLRAIEKTIRQTIPVRRDHPFANAANESQADAPAPRRSQGRGQGRNSRGPGAGGSSRSAHRGGRSSQPSRPARPDHAPSPRSHSPAREDRAPHAGPKVGAKESVKPRRSFFGFGRKKSAPAGKSGRR